MSEPARPPAREEIAAAIEWWRDAGVDNLYHDDATAWLAQGEPAPAAAPTPAVEPPVAPGPRLAQRPVEEIARPPFGGPEQGWPDRLDRFAPWWLAEPALEIGGTGPRIAPRGLAEPPLMVVVAHPEEEDRDTLLSGEQGRLLLGFLRAAGLEAERVYLASLLPRFTAAPDWVAAAMAGAGKVLAHHIGLVSPQRLLILGGNILPLLGNDTAQEGKTSRHFNHKGRSFPFVEGQGPARLLRSAAARRALWHSWLDGTDG